MSLRGGGISKAPWDSQNLGLAVGDDARAVAQHRSRWAVVTGAQPVWLQQVHGRAVLELTHDKLEWAALQAADAAWTQTPGLACSVMVADCLPVLLACRDGRAVAAAHAGWRGLAAGVLQATVQALCRGSGAQARDLLAWLGPCIGPRQFEVGIDVLQAFKVPSAAGPDSGPAAASGPGPQRHFVLRRRADGSQRWLADLHGLARDVLLQLGLVEISADPACTVQDSSRFFSFRRSGITGRHVCSVWLR